MQTNGPRPIMCLARQNGLPSLFKDRIFIFLAVSAAAVLLLLAVQTLAAESASVHGLILDSEMGAVLEADDGDIYFLEGPDMTPYFDTLATVTGMLTSDEGGNRYIDVHTVVPDLEAPAPPSDGIGPLNMNDETGTT